MFEEKSWFDNFPLTGRGILFFIALVAVCFLVGCGGGGGDEPQAETPVAETPKYHVPNGPAVGPAKGNEPGVVCDTTYPAPSGCRKL